MLSFKPRFIHKDLRLGAERTHDTPLQVRGAQHNSRSGLPAMFFALAGAMFRFMCMAGAFVVSAQEAPLVHSGTPDGIPSATDCAMRQFAWECVALRYAG